MGDFNMNMLSLSTEACELLDVLECYGCCHLIDLPTRVAGTTKTLINFCFTSCPAKSTCAGVLATDRSDNMPICYFPLLKALKKNKKRYIPLKYRDINACTLERCCSLVAETAWMRCVMKENPNKSYELFTGK